MVNRAAGFWVCCWFRWDLCLLPYVMWLLDVITESAFARGGGAVPLSGMAVVYPGIVAVLSSKPSLSARVLETAK